MITMDRSVTKEPYSSAIGFLYQHVPTSGKSWNVAYRQELARLCCAVIEEYSKEGCCQPIYWQVVRDACRALIGRVDGKGKEIAQNEWPNNIDWFDADDYLVSFAMHIVDIAERNELLYPDGLLYCLKTFMDQRSPCSSFCIARCFQLSQKYNIPLKCFE